MRHLIFSLVLSVSPLFASAQRQPGLELPPQVVSPSFADSQWKPTDAQALRLTKETYDYFSAKDRKRFTEAYAKFSELQKQTVPYEGWKSQLEEFYGKAGAVQGRKISRITWYRNPPNAKPGIYAAADFSSQFENLALHCGFAAWHQQMDGSFELVREESTSLSKADAARMTPEMLQGFRAQFRC